MAQYKPYALNALPTTGIDVNGIYFIPSGNNKFNIFIRNNANSEWYDLGVINGVNKVNNLIGDVQLDLSFSNAGILSLTGSSATVNLDARYRKLSDSVPWSDVSGAPAFALDANVVHKTGNETVAGVKTFSSSPVVPTATTNTQAVNLEQMAAADNNLQTQINNILSAVNEGLKTPMPINCSANPNYPASQKGDTYKVTHAGKIGGASGIAVEVNDMIICTATSPAGTQASVGANFFITQSNIDEATETVFGYAKIATQAQVNAGTDDKAFVTSKKLAVKLSAQDGVNDGKYVKYNAAQTLTTPQQTQARDNIGAAADNAVVKLTGAQTVNGAKTFNDQLSLVSDPVSNNHATRKSYVDNLVASAVSWGGVNGKEW